MVIENDRITYVGAYGHTPLNAKTGHCVDLADDTLLPGFVNTHCHLEHSALKGLTTPQRPFTEWVKEVTRENASLTRGDVRSGVSRGIEALIRGGTTTLADHCHPDTEPFATPFRRVLFWEVLGAHMGRARECLEKARRRAADEGGFVTPHSLYAVHEEVSEQILAESQSRQSLHILESADEDRFFRRQDGPLAVYVQERGGDLDFPFSSPVRWLEAHHRLNSGCLLVHGNHLIPSEIGILRGSGASVIHCPGSHRFFGHKRFPLEDLKAAGVRMALGTDGLASNEDLSMLREMRLLKETYPRLTDEEVINMATIEGARALGMEKEIGSIEVGKKADLIAVRGTPLEAESVVFSMVDGRVCLNP
ncbi:MAG TPA: amidohydrolase family protein [bacterium]|nr:amidohydrolase family protein [bacterium]